MREVNLHRFEDVLTSTFRRYLFTKNLVADNQPELRNAFWSQLQSRDFFTREPMVSAIPAYETSLCIRELVGRSSPPNLHRRLLDVNTSEIDLDRKLYQHQVESIDKAQLGRNIIVATGTGSGKTECFLLPILDDALKNPGPGVRAIIVYPLNALANDQLDRLRALLRNIPEITFGRYTGDTPWNMDGVGDRDRAEILRPNERFTREHIRQEPPHILLTNFAMLEYLLLRPGDNPIFKQRPLRYIVLDEAHTYSGAQGIEVSLLMRRLRESYRDSKLQFILTSATLSDANEESRRGVAIFGEKLTGNQFDDSDVLLGAISNPFATCKGSPVSVDQYIAVLPSEAAFNDWLVSLEDIATLRDLVSKCGLAVPRAAIESPTVARALYEWLRDNHEAAAIHKLCSERPYTISELAEQLWGRTDNDAMRIIRWITVLGANAVPYSKSLPLLPARFHLFYRGLAGASVCVSPSCKAREGSLTTFWSKFVLEDRVECPDCFSAMLPLQTCVHCGLAAVAVVEDPDGGWRTVRVTDTEKIWVLTWDKDVFDDIEEEENRPRVVFLCMNCKAFAVDRALESCCDAPKIAQFHSIGNSTGNGGVQVCPRCGGSARPYPSVLQAFATGEDAPTAVLAEAMVRALPGEDTAKPAGGRRILSFSDSRQRAAHFAPYLAQTTAESQFMKPVLDAVHHAVKSCAEGTTFNEVATRFVSECQKQPYVVVRTTDDEGERGYDVKRTATLSLEDRKSLNRECLVALFQNFTASPRSRRTIPSLGLASVEVDFNDWQIGRSLELLPELFADGRDGFALLQNLLGVVLYRRAIELPEGLRAKMIGQGPASATYHFSEQGDVPGRRRFRWNPYEAKEKLRKNAIAKSYISGLVAKHLGLDAALDSLTLAPLLTRIWDTLKDLDILMPAHPAEYQVPYDRLVIRANRQWHLCERCGRLTVFPLGQSCASHDCAGQVQHLTELQLRDRFDNHHWYYRLLRADPLCMVVKEHTAQLVNERGREYQRDFRDRKINVLSSSTTFEMGVDVGQLKAVFLRNVPPTPANYIQRAGRAGRRRDGAAFAVCFARSTPHDQFHFHDPLAIVQGKVPIPQINLANSRLAQRHVNSFLLGQYLLANKMQSDGERISVNDFFLLPSSGESHASKFPRFLAARAGELASALQRIIPPQSGLSPNDAINASANHLRGTGGVADRLSARIDEYEKQQAQLEEQLSTALKNKETDRLSALGRAIKSAAALKKQLVEDTLIDFLSAEHWLPSYAFPQDVVRLLVRQEKYTDRMRLERDGEIGLSEYAPGSEIVADGKLFKSGGIDLQHKELERRQYRVCNMCRRVEFFAESQPVPRACGACGCIPKGPLGVARKYVRPPGFTTLFEDPVEEPNLFRLRPPPNSEVFLVQGADEDAFSVHADFPNICCGYTQKGQLFRANPGRKYKAFRICAKCGRYFDKTPRKPDHDTPWGSPCRGAYIIATDLAFQFDTDTLQLRFVGKPSTEPVSDESFWLSLQTAFVSAAAEVLSIPTNDIAATYQDGPTSHPELVIYDRVPGGAGYVDRIRRDLRAIFEAAFKRTSECRNPLCDPTGSCYACLRSYRNQFKWAQLNRGKVATWLSELLSMPPASKQVENYSLGAASAPTVLS